MDLRRARIWKFLLILLVNAALLAGLLLALEYALRRNDPFLQLPFDSYYYTRSQAGYDRAGLKLPAEPGYYTWGHRVQNNRFGFRERDFATPKPVGVCRVMVLGDSLTWGAGLAAEERYTALAETALNQAFPGRTFEVLNFGVSGIPTTVERDILQDYYELVNPDLVVVGFVYNDTQPRSQGYTLEKEQFDRKYGPEVRAAPDWLRRAGLFHLAGLTQTATDNFLVASGILPPWEVGLQRTYEQDSAEWQEFEQALRDIKAISDELELPPPVFAILNSDIYLDRLAGPDEAAESLPVYLRWYRQAGQAAAETGFAVYDHEQEFIEQLRPWEIPVNALDNHPSARANQVYGQKLFQALAAAVDRGEMCPPDSPQAARPASAAEYVTARRLMQVRLGDQLRFLGYTAQNFQAGRESPVQLTLGWQALAPVSRSYTVRLSLVGPAGPQLVRESLPCQGGCPTNQWPAGLVVVPGSSVIYWPLLAGAGLLPLDRVFQRSHLAARRNERDSIQVVPVPVDLLPFGGALVDQYTIEPDPGLPAGQYSLLLTLVDAVSSQLLPAYDEVTNQWLPDDAVALGQVDVP